MTSFFDKTTIRPTDFMVALLSITEMKRPLSFFMKFLAVFSVILYFAQMISYLIRQNQQLENDWILLFLKEAFFYSCFTNLLYYFSLDSLSELILFVAYGFTFFLPIYVSFKAFMMKSKKGAFSGIKSIMESVDILLHTIFCLYPWLLQTPSLSLFINVIDCDPLAYFTYQRENCTSVSGPYVILSVLCIIISISFGFLIVTFSKNLEFYDVSHSNPIKSENTALFAVVYILKCCLPISYPFIKRYESINIILFVLIVSFSILDFLRRPPFRERIISRSYISWLMILIAMLFCEIFVTYSNFIEISGMLYIEVIIVIFCMKFGLNLCNGLYCKRIIKDFNDVKLLDYLGEEVMILQFHSEINRKDRLYCLGILKKHVRLCQIKNCKLKLKHLNSSTLQAELSSMGKIFSFIAQAFSNKLKAIVRKTEDSIYFERLLLKYITFLIQSKINCLKAFYELQKFKTSSQKSLSFFFRVHEKLIKKAIKMKLSSSEMEKTFKSENSPSTELKVSEFFKIDAEKKAFEKKTKRLINEKVKFWERFKDGFKSYEDLIQVVYLLVEKIQNFQRFLEGSLNQKGLISLKFLSILHSAMFNSINEAIHYEDEIDNFKKRCMNVDKENISNFSFFNRDLAICQVSLLNLKGTLLESGKTPKLAEIFGYQLIDLKNVRYITQLMPPCIASKHEFLIIRSLDRETKDFVASKRTISSFAIDKKGFIFKIRVFFSQCFQYHADFVMNAAVIKVEEKGNKPGVIFDHEGGIQGMNEEFYKFLKSEHESIFMSKKKEKSSEEKFNEITLQDFNLLNIYALIPKIREFVAENEIFKDRTNQTIRNESAILEYPENLSEIIEKLRARKKEADLSERSGTYSHSKLTLNSVRTVKSKLSMKENITEMNKKDQYTLKNIKENPTNTISIRNFNPEQLILQTTTETRKYRISFDLVVQFFIYGKRFEEAIIIMNLQILKMQPLKKEIGISTTKIFQEAKEPKFCNLWTEQNLMTMKEPVGEIKMSAQENLLTKRSTRKNTDDDDIVNDNPQSFIKIPPNIPVPSHDFGRKVQEGLLADEEKNLNETFMSVVLPAKDVPSKILASIPEENEPEKVEKPLAKPPAEKKLHAFSSLTNSNGLPFSTEKKDLPDLLEKQSQKASSLSSMKKTFGIFATIKSIQERTPISIKGISFISFSELIVIAIYCIILYQISISYISENYLPLQRSMINFCQSSVDFNFGVLSISQYEYWYYNYTTSKVNGSLWNEYAKIVNESVVEGSSVLYEEMNKPLMFNYQTVLFTRTRTFIDYITKKVSNITYIPMFQFFLDVLNDFSGSSPTEILNNTKYLNILQRNYYYFYLINNNIITAIQTDFQNSNDEVTSQFENIMIVLISIFTFGGILKMMQFSFYNSRLMKILNVILRMQSMQIFNEITLYKDMQKLFEDPFDHYLNVYFSEKVINSKSLVLDETKDAIKSYEKSLKIQKVQKKNLKLKHNIKKISLLNIKPLSKIRPLIFIAIIFAIAFGYLYSNFFMWETTNSSIADLIDININFNKLYYYSAFMLMANNLMIREKIIRDSAYESSGEVTQTMSSRLNSLNRSYIARLKDFNNYISSISTYGVRIQNDYNDDQYDKILQGNLCDVLNETQMVNSYEYSFCKTGLNKAFLQGLSGLLNEYRNNLLYYTNMTDLVPSNDTLGNQIQIANIKKWISSRNQTDVNMGGYLVCKVVLIFYKKVNEYYYTKLNDNINAFLVFLLVTTCFCSFFFALLMLLSFKYLKQIYKNVSFSLLLIPYEKLINDEQISFLIKQIAKDK